MVNMTFANSKTLDQPTLQRILITAFAFYLQKDKIKQKRSAGSDLARMRRRNFGFTVCILHNGCFLKFCLFNVLDHESEEIESATYDGTDRRRVRMIRNTNMFDLAIYRVSWTKSSEKLSPSICKIPSGHMTFKQGHTNVTATSDSTLHRRSCDVVLMPCARWVQ